MDWLDSVGGAISGVGGWLGDNSGWIGPAITLAGGLYAMNQRDDTSQRLFDEMRDAEDRNYQEAEDYRAWYEEMAKEEAVVKAIDEAKLKKGLEAKLAALQQAKQIYQPYHDTALSLLPKMQGTYEKGLANLDKIVPHLINEEALKKLSTYPKMNEMVVPLPAGR